MSQDTFRSSRLPGCGAAAGFGSAGCWLCGFGGGVDDGLEGASPFDSCGVSFFGGDGGGGKADSWLSSFLGSGSEDVGCWSDAGAFASVPPCSFSAP